VEVAAELIPPSCADYFVEKVIEHCLTTEGDYHRNFSSLFNSKVKQIRTKVKYLNNPENITSAFENLSKCELLQQLDISAEICLKIPKILQEFVKIFPSVETVKSLKLLACQYILSDSDITLRFLEKLAGANQLRELEIPGAVFDDLAFKELLKLKQLCSLNIDNCKFSTVETVQLLTGLPKLRCLECTQGRQSKVVQALSTLHHSTRLNLTHLTFRQPPRPPLHLLNTILPRLWSAKVIWNVFEIGYSSAIDQGLAQLHQLERVTQLALEVGIHR